MSHLFLAGFRGTGKSTLARVLSDRLAIPAVDLDERIEARSGLSIREIFDRHGEAGFRERESETLREVIDHPPSIIALGGGAVLSAPNRTLIARSGRCCVLRAQPETLIKRIEQDAQTRSQRPSLTGLSLADEVRSLIAAREPLYHEVADLEIDTDTLSIEAVVKIVADWWMRGERSASAKKPID